MWNVNVVLLFAPALMCSMVNSLQFEVKPSHPQCISEDIKSNVVTVGNYHVVNPNQGYSMPDSLKITSRVRSPTGTGLHYGNNVFSGDFSFTTVEAGDYSACFSVLTADVTVDFVWTIGVAANDNWSHNVAKKDQIDVMESELKRLYDTVSWIHEEMFYLREREAEMQVINDETNSKMFTYSFISILVCLSVAGLQIWHLKSFFEKKKLV